MKLFHVEQFEAGGRQKSSDGKFGRVNKSPDCGYGEHSEATSIDGAIRLTVGLPFSVRGRGYGFRFRGGGGGWTS